MAFGGGRCEGLREIGYYVVKPDRQPDSHKPGGKRGGRYLARLGFRGSTTMTKLLGRYVVSVTRHGTRQVKISLCDQGFDFILSLHESAR